MSVIISLSGFIESTFTVSIKASFISDIIGFETVDIVSETGSESGSIGPSEGMLTSLLGGISCEYATFPHKSNVK